jgi:hypothetical protein
VSASEGAAFGRKQTLLLVILLGALMKCGEKSFSYIQVSVSNDQEMNEELGRGCGCTRERVAGESKLERWRWRGVLEVTMESFYSSLRSW